MARYVITGGSGFLGTSLAAELLNHGHTVIVASRGHRRPILGDWIEYDLSRPATAANIANCNPSGVFHLAWSGVPATVEADPAADAAENLPGTIALFDALQAAETPVVFASSGGTVYGKTDVLPIPEHHPLRPIAAHGVAKAAAESYGAFYRRARHLDIRIARLGNPFGSHHRGDGPQGAASIFARQICGRRPVTVFGDGGVVRDYLHVSDAVRALLAIMEMPRTESPVVPTYNVGSGTGLSVRDLVTAISRLARVEAQVGFDAPRSIDVPANILDTRLLRANTTWRPRLDFDQAMTMVVEEVMAVIGR